MDCTEQPFQRANHQGWRIDTACCKHVRLASCLTNCGWHCSQHSPVQAALVCGGEGGGGRSARPAWHLQDATDRTISCRVYGNCWCAGRTTMGHDGDRAECCPPPSLPRGAALIYCASNAVLMVGVACAQIQVGWLMWRCRLAVARALSTPMRNRDACGSDALC